MAALAAGEQHPLGAIIAAHSAALLTRLRAMLEPDDPLPPDGQHRSDEAEDPAGRYQRIPVTVHQ